MTFPLDASRIVIVAPHPDDEVLGPGGLLATASDRGAEIVLVAVTDGGGCFGLDWRGAAEVSALEERRTRETERALSELLDPSAPVPRVVRLGLPDQRVSAHEVDVRQALEGVLAAGDACLFPHREDGHADHEATARAALAACAATGATPVEYAIWLGAFTEPADARGAHARSFELSPAVHARKQRAIACFQSQFETVVDAPGSPVLGDEELARFTGPHEVVYL